MTGYFIAQVMFKDTKINGRVYIAKKGAPILGWIHQVALGIQFRPWGHGANFISEAYEWDRTLSWIISAVFSDRFNTLEGFHHKIVLKKGSQPKLQTVMTISLREQVKVEIDKLLADNIIEEIESSDWLAPIVTERKPELSVRVCIDLHNLSISHG